MPCVWVVGIGFTIYPGSAQRFEMYQQIRAYAEEAKLDLRFNVVIWSYVRGSGIESAAKLRRCCGYAAQIAAQLGVHIKVKLPTEHIEREAARHEQSKFRLGL